MSHAPPEELKDSLTFTVVRNPYTKAVSAWQFLQESTKYDFSKMSLLDMLKSPPTRYGPAYHFSMTQKSLMCVEGVCLVDRIIHFENLSNELPELFDECGIAYDTIPHLNKTQSGYMPSENEKEKIYEFFKEDFSFLGYEK
jgi:hypothetical protein